MKWLVSTILRQMSSRSAGARTGRALSVIAAWISGNGLPGNSQEWGAMIAAVLAAVFTGKATQEDAEADEESA